MLLHQTGAVFAAAAAAAAVPCAYNCLQLHVGNDDVNIPISLLHRQRDRTDLFMLLSLESKVFDLLVLCAYLSIKNGKVRD